MQLVMQHCISQAEIPPLLQKSEVHHRVHKGPQLDSVMNYLNALLILRTRMYTDCTVLNINK